MKKYLALSISICSLTASLTPATATPAPSTQESTPTINLTAPPTFRAVPPDAAPCLPTAQVASTEVIGRSVYKGNTYYLITAYNDGGFPSDVVISTQKDQCQQLYYNPSGENAPFPDSVPEPVARQLNSQRPK